MYKISEEKVKALMDYLLKSPCPSNEVQAIVIDLRNLEKVEPIKESTEIKSE